MFKRLQRQRVKLCFVFPDRILYRDYSDHFLKAIKMIAPVNLNEGVINKVHKIKRFKNVKFWYHPEKKDSLCWEVHLTLLFKEKRQLEQYEIYNLMNNLKESFRMNFDSLGHCLNCNPNEVLSLFILIII